MTQAQGQRVAQEDAALSFKRFILEESSAFEAEPMADLFRVNLLGQMLNRYEELLGRGLSGEAAVQRVKREYGNIPQQMREEGFLELGQARVDSRWMELTEDEAAQYIKERSRFLHQRAMGAALCSACVMPMMVGCALGELFWLSEDFFLLFGLLGMFGMIGMGVYSLATAAKPKNREKIKKGHFSLSASLRRRLSELAELTEEKARRRKAKGIALLVTCAAPIFVGAMLSELFFMMEDFGPLLGTAGLFVMVGLGVYEIMMSDGEKKTMRDLLGKKKTDD